MTEQEKQLLLKDLCARLPYKVRCKCVNGLGGGKTDKGVLKYIGNCNGVISNYYEDIPIDSGFVNNVFYPIENIKPYLRPMSSMTEEERKEYKDMNVLDNCDEFSNIKKNIEDIKKNGEENYIQLPRTHAQDYLNSIHVDYRGLIEKGLALVAPEGMYNI